MKKILCLVSCRYAINNLPHLPQVVMFAGETYAVGPNGVSEAIASRAVEKEQCEFAIEILVALEAAPESNVEPEFDVNTATKRQLKDFVQADEDLDDIVDLRTSVEDIRSVVKAYLEA